ncbi:HlyD family secretion protein [Pandoraea terrae]|nr:HlyD family efflux transporter periplasmic adaptor subunit [Pandoraea terrae]
MVRVVGNAPLPVIVGIGLALAGCAPKPDNVYQGYVEGEFVYVATSQAGRLDRLAVKRGQDVAAGAPLFALEATYDAAAQQQARDQLAAAEAQLHDIETGKRPAELDVTRAQLAQAIAASDRAATQWKRDEVQYAAGGISREQLEASRADARTSAARVSELQSSLAVARLPGREAQRQAQAAQVAAARAALAQADWTLDQKRVAATRAGRVYDTMYREGEWVPAGSPVVRMLPPQNVKVRFFIPEAVLGRLKTGQGVRIRCDGCAAIDAKITYIANDAEYTPPVIYSNDSRGKLVYLVEAYPGGADAMKLHPGQPVQVTLP